MRSNQAGVSGQSIKVAPVNWEMDAMDSLPAPARFALCYGSENIAALTVQGFLRKRLREGQPEHLAVHDAMASLVRFMAASLAQRASEYQQRYKAPLPHVGAHAHFQPPPRLGPVGRRWHSSAKVLRMTAHLEPREGLAA
jgi:hypothetical protein